MVKAYRVIEKTYICGELENTYKCNKVLYTEAEAQEYNENHTYLYDTVEKIKEWHKKNLLTISGQELKLYIHSLQTNFSVFTRIRKLIS